jgi:hypothetical protein
MISVTEKHIGQGHQLLFAIERLPADTDVSKFEILRFEQRQGLLRADAFDQAVAAVGHMVRTLKHAVNSFDANS